MILSLLSKPYVNVFVPLLYLGTRGTAMTRYSLTLFRR
jgi:hypothetical protein